MNWFRRMLRQILLEREVPVDYRSVVADERESTERTMAAALVFGMEVQDSALGVVEHSARVSLVSDWIAQQSGIHDADRYILQLAARLHELGMFAIPSDLLHRRAPLTTAELETVRSQARTSARVARLAHPPRVARLIEHQYDDYRRLAQLRPLPDRDLLLAGILRVADVFAAVTWPRPYQDPMPAHLRDSLLEKGAGSLFHPAAVRSALAVGTGQMLKA